MAEAEKRPQFGNRFLKDPRQVFEHNAWDNVEWDDEQEAEARSKVEANSSKMVDEEMRETYEAEAFKFWDEFYMQHQNRFFKDRHWLFTEFPELLPADEKSDTPVPERIVPSNNELRTESDKVISDDIEKKEEFTDGVTDSEPIRDWTETELKSNIAKNSNTDSSTGDFPGMNSNKRIFEVGCGVGNTVFPVLQTNNDSGLFIYCCDLSETAIQLVKDHEDYKGGRCHAFVCDVSQPEADLPFPDDSLDIVILIFVLSAVHPDKMQGAINRLARCLKPGGKMVFRDYGRYDLAQLRFKNGRCLAENFYVRGDGTRVYFFTQEELDDMFTKAGLEKEQNLVDRRLQVNRGRQIKMYRVWIQCKYYKPTSES